MSLTRLLLFAALALPTYCDAQEGPKPLADSTAGAFDCDVVLDCNGFPVPPEMIGGMDALRMRLQYPPAARAARVEGIVVVRFHVGPDGRPTRLEIARTPDPRLNAEALRVVGETRFEWTHYTTEDQRQTDLTLPVRFQLVP